MASPPRQSPATSPSYPTHVTLSNPKKRPSINTAGGPSKRRKQAGSVSSLPGSAHPLRQTSFPPEESARSSALRSPSVDSDFTGVTEGKSVITTATGRKKRSKGKRRGASGSIKSGVRGKVGDRAQREASEVVDDEDEDEDDDVGDTLLDGEEVSDGAEKKKMSVLVNAFDKEQTERHEVFRRIKLRKETVRKIANQTLSQSVPPAVLITINGYTKVFIGTLIERAREVQEQWAALDPVSDTPRTQIPIDPTDFHLEDPNNDAFRMTGSKSSSGPVTGDTLLVGDNPHIQSAQSRDLGPLLPDHFREALRRYKLDGEKGATGLTGVSVGLGLQGAGSTRLEGRRLFR